MPEKVAADKSCDLCGLPVKITGIEIKSAESRKVFCCLGCKSIYALYNGNEEEPRSFIGSDDSQQK